MELVPVVDPPQNDGAHANATSPTPAPCLQEAALQSFIGGNSWGDSSLLTWKSRQVEVGLGEGSGQYSSPFSISSEQFVKTCQRFGFSARILRRLGDHVSSFEHVFHFSELNDASNHMTRGGRPSHLEIAVSAYEVDAFFAIVRYDLKRHTAKCLAFIKTGDYMDRRRVRASEHLEALEGQWESLERQPLLVLNTILTTVQLRVHEYLDWRIRLNGMESQLGVTRYAEALREGRYEKISHDFEILNADVASLSKKAADNALSASTVLEHAKALLRLVVICDGYDTLVQDKRLEHGIHTTSEAQEEVHSTVKRAELYIEFTKMVQLVLQSQTAILYNRISRQDSQSMKTIAVVTLFFLPSTFVSAVFASGIFNFHANDPSNAPRIISTYGWVFLLICILATVCTLALWLVWYTWGRKILERSRLSVTHGKIGKPKWSKFWSPRTTV